MSIEMVGVITFIATVALLGWAERTLDAPRCDASCLTRSSHR